MWLAAKSSERRSLIRSMLRSCAANSYLQELLKRLHQGSRHAHIRTPFGEDVECGLFVAPRVSKWESGSWKRSQLLLENS